MSNHYSRVEPDDDPAEVVDRYVAVNNLGTTHVLRAFAPLLRDGGRLLVVAGTLKPTGLTLAQYVALTELHQQPGITGASLARASVVTPQAMMVVLKSMPSHQKNSIP